MCIWMSTVYTIIDKDNTYATLKSKAVNRLYHTHVCAFVCMYSMHVKYIYIYTGRGMYVEYRYAAESVHVDLYNKVDLK